MPFRFYALLKFLSIIYSSWFCSSLKLKNEIYKKIILLLKNLTKRRSIFVSCKYKQIQLKFDFIVINAVFVLKNNLY